MQDQQMIAETVTIDKPEIIDTQSIETVLKSNFGEPLRWSIVEVGLNTLKICITYEN